MRLLTILTCLFLSFALVQAQERPHHGHSFEQLGSLLPDPNEYRAMDGSPGPHYWQQRCDYDIECTLDTDKQRLDGKETITYYNQSPQTLRYLWLQLDENEHAADNYHHHASPSNLQEVMGHESIRRLAPWEELSKYGHKLQSVTDAAGKALKYTVSTTMMRIDLPKPLEPGQQFTFHIAWHYYLIDRMKHVTFGRGGYEYFEDDENYLYTITQWYPRLCVFSDFEGWQSNQFTGRGEFALTFGNFKVKMTLPNDFMVGSTGECRNYQETLTPVQFQRWQQAQSAKEPLQMVTLDEAKDMEKRKKSKTLTTWRYEAENVRDFAWTASRKFIWDAMPTWNEDGKKIMCMSYFPKESYPIYSRFSTKAVAHTLKTYSSFSIPFPYPVAISVEARNGMEYPMICFNPGRAQEDGTYSEDEKIAAILVIIHEVGHNYFPMIINSDERQWAWFDEGVNSFMQFITEQQWDNNFDSGGGIPSNITEYMSRPKDQLEPIMTNSENIIDYGNNAYDKPATALNILRETVMGRETFDFAFREYCRRWAFKHPTPADFFRTMEDASGMDLDWFWRGWFYTTDAVDISIDSISWQKVDLENNPEPKEETQPRKYEKPFDHLTKIRNREEGIAFPVEQDTSLQDFYTFYKPWETADSVETTTVHLHHETYSKKEKRELFGNKNYYQLHFSNKGGLVTPVILEWTFTDGTTEIEHIPVEIWRKNERNFSEVFVKEKQVKSVRLDPYKETADIDEKNNTMPIPAEPKLFMVYKSHKVEHEPNMMQKAKKRKVNKP